MYQAPMVVVNGMNFFIGDYVYISSKKLPVIESFQIDVSMNPGDIVGPFHYHIGHIKCFYSSVDTNGETTLFVTLESLVPAMSISVFQSTVSPVDIILDTTTIISLSISELVSYVTL